MTQLKRTLGLPLVMFFGLGNILGAGIYVLIGKVAGEAGMFTPVGFLVAAFIASFSAFTYSELSARFPNSAGEALYVDKGFSNRFLSRLTGLMIALAGMIASATIFRGFYGYFSTFIQLPEWLVITAIVLAMGLLIIWGISQSVRMAALLTIAEIGGLLLVIWAGRDLLVGLPEHLPVLTPSLDSTVWVGIFLGAFLAFFAFLGFEDMVNIAEEVKDPERTMPAAILLALLIATLIYTGVALVAVLAMDQQTLASSDAPLADVLVATSDINPAIISFIGMFAVINGALIQMIMASRMFYGMARQGWLWQPLSRVSERTHTPVNASWLVILIVLNLALWFPLEDLAKTSSFIILCVFSLVHVALIRIKRQGPTPSGVICVPLWVPVSGLICCVGLLLVQLIAG